MTHLVMFCHDCDNYHFDLGFAHTHTFSIPTTLENLTIIARRVDLVRNPSRRCERADNTVYVEKSTSVLSTFELRIY